MQPAAIWRTDLEDPASADVIVVASGSSAEEETPARQNSDRFASLLRERGVRVVVLEADELNSDTAANSSAPEVLRQLLRLAPPKALVLFGEKAVRNVSRITSTELPKPPLPGAGLAEADLNGCRVVPLMSLAPPAWNRWKRWAWPYLTEVADDVAGKLADLPRAA